MMAFLRASYDPLTERMRPVSTLHRQANAAALAEFTERLIDARPEWQAEGNCVGTPKATFFPGRGATNRHVESIKAICEGCPVIGPCLEMGMAERFGIWGGTSENERRTLRRERNQEAS